MGKRCGGRWREGEREGEEKREVKELGLGLGLKRRGPKGRESEWD